MSWTLDPLPLRRILIPGWGDVDGAAAVDDGLPGWFAPFVTITVDSGIGADRAEVNALRMAVRDGGLGADVSAARLRELVTDAGLGSDRIVVRPRMGGVDAGVGRDAARLGVRATDTGMGSDSALWRPRFKVVDAAAGADMATGYRLRAPNAVVDAAAGSDSATCGFAPQAAAPSQYTVPGTYTYVIPVWCRCIDVIVLGGGAGGEGAGLFLNGGGGGAGGFSWITLTRGVDIPWSAITITIVVGSGGSRGSGGAAPSGGGSGVPSTASWPGGSLSGVGGTPFSTNIEKRGRPVTNGNASGGRDLLYYSLDGAATTYVGGDWSTSTTTPNSPGGGGAGGGLPGGNGAPGAPGRVWLRAYQ
ncbi:minor tail protein [Mycobacterium phage Curiosium]|uniref:Minor tail protein n=1 Tax=Mycobacterium phage Curiosium TaxID=2599859 RepID=A0A5J6TVJ0_9CAUD|nr:minor tail protein [Mycobacterium phage Curiosium]QFG14074.1 minor tail protein [Mycobacterium phage Curiosium]